MDTNETNNDLVEQIKKLPKELRAFLDADFDKGIDRVVIKHGLVEPKAGNLYEETMLVVIGLVEPQDFTKNLETEAGFTEDEVSRLIPDIYEFIFKPLQALAKKPETPTPSPVIPIPPSPTPEPIAPPVVTETPPAPEIPPIPVPPPFKEIHNEIIPPRPDPLPIPPPTPAPIPVPPIPITPIPVPPPPITPPPPPAPVPPAPIVPQSAPIQQNPSLKRNYAVDPYREPVE